MKEIKKCHLTSILFKPFAFLLAFACSCLYLVSSFGSQSVSAASVNLNGFADRDWVGLADAISPTNTGYIGTCDWFGSSSTCTIGKSSSSANQYASLSNLSYSAPINLTTDMFVNNRLQFSGTVELLFYLRTNSPADTAMAAMGSNYPLFTSANFGVGIDKNLGVYDAENVEVIDFKRSFNTSQMNDASKRYVTVTYKISFKASYSYFDTPGSYRLNWRLNGNGATNNTKTSQWMGYYMTLNSRSSYYVPFVATSYDLDIATGGSVAPDPDPVPDPDPPSTGSDDQENFNKLFDQNNQIIGGLDDVNQSIKDGQDQAHKDAQDTQQAIKDQQKAEQDRYDQDKKEESDRENQGNADANQAQGIFNFNLLNPFAPLFNLFSPNQCVDIPILANFVHSESSQYCSWFPSSVRSILTPAFGIVSIMLLFGFVVRWLGGSEVIKLTGDKS